MKKNISIGILFGILLLSSTTAMCDQKQDSDINARLSNLQVRMRNFHKQTARKIEERLNPAVSVEPIIASAVKYQPSITVDNQVIASNEVIKELDESKEASIMVLFHDNQFFDEKEANNQKNDLTPKIEFESESQNTKNQDNSSIVSNPNSFLYNDNLYNVNDYAEKYEELKRRLYTSNNTYINNY